MDEQKRLIKNTGIIAIGNLGTKLVSFFLLPLYTALLSTSQYGTVDYIITVATFVVPFVSLLMDESMFRFLIDCGTEQERKTVISTTMAMIIAGCGVFLVIAVPLLAAIRYTYGTLLVLYILTSVFSIMISALLRGIGRTDKYAQYNFAISFLQILLNILFIVVLSMRVEGMMLASILSQFVIPVGYILQGKLWRYFDFRSVRKEKAVEMVRYSLPLIPNKISWSIINLSDRMIIMNVLGSDSAGLYAVSNKFPSMMDTIYGFFYQSWKESSARVMGEKDQDAFYNMIYGYLKDFLYAVVLGMTAFMPLVFRLLVNADYGDALGYVPVLLLATYFANISGFYGGIFTAYKDTKIMGGTTAVAAVINLAVNLLMIARFGLYAAAISTLVANFVVYIYRKVKVRRHVKLRENRGKQLCAIGATAVIAVLFYTGSPVWRGVGCLVAVVYAVAVNLPLLKTVLGALKKK